MESPFFIYFRSRLRLQVFRESPPDFFFELVILEACNASETEAESEVGRSACSILPFLSFFSFFSFSILLNFCSRSKSRKSQPDPICFPQVYMKPSTTHYRPSTGSSNCPPRFVMLPSSLSFVSDNRFRFSFHVTDHHAVGRTDRSTKVESDWHKKSIFLYAMSRSKRRHTNFHVS